MKICLALLMLLCLPVAMMAQFSYKPGFIVTNSNDTTAGFLKEDIETNLYKSIVFANTETGGGEKTLQVTDIKGFGFSGANVYQRVQYNDVNGAATTQFAHVMVAGYYRLFSFQTNSRQFFLIKNNEDSTYLLYDDEVTNMGFMQAPGNYKNQLLFLSLSCGNLRNGLNSIGFSTGDMIDYVQSINKCKSPNTTSQVLYKKPATTFRLYAYAGGIVLGESANEFTGRVMARLVVPTVSQSTTLNFGVSYMAYSRLEHKTPTYDLPYWATSAFKQNVIQLPFYIQHNFLKGIIQPYVNAGLSLVHQSETGGYGPGGYSAKPVNKFGVGMTAALGVECPITPNLFIKADWTYELIMHHPVVGIAYFFK